MKRDTISWKFCERRLARLPVLPPFHLDFHFPRDIYITDNVIRGKKIAYRLVLSTPAWSGTNNFRFSSLFAQSHDTKEIVIFLAIEALVGERKIIVSFVRSFDEVLFLMKFELLSVFRANFMRFDCHWPCLINYWKCY